jgi:hypothetical protein
MKGTGDQLGDGYRDDRLNSKFDCLHGRVKDREEVVIMRGMDHKESAQTLMEEH